MRILLVQAYLGRREPPVAPLGLATLAAYLRDYEVKIFDPNVAADPLQATASLIAEFEPQIIGVSLRNLDTTKYSDQFLYFEHFQRYVRFLRQSSRTAALVVGGTAFSLFPQQIMQRTPELDFGFYLEAELSFHCFVQGQSEFSKIPGLYYRANAEIVFSGPLSSRLGEPLLPPAWELVNLTPYLQYDERASIGIETKRGCALKCAYCTYPQLSGAALRLKAPAQVAEEVVRLHELSKVKRVFFCDAVFNYPLEHAQAICQELLDRGINIRWGAYQQDRFLSAEYVALARLSGCDEFYFSPDAASDQGLKILQKATNVQSLERSLQLIAADGEAKASYNFFAAVPDTGFKNTWAALRFLRRARRTLGKRLLRYKLSYIRLEPNTPLAQTLFGSGASATDNLLPRNSAELNRLFVRKTRARCLNLFLAMHYYLGKWWGKKNVIT